MFKNIYSIMKIVIRYIIFSPTENDTSLELKGKVAVFNSITLGTSFFLTPFLIQTYLMGNFSKNFEIAPLVLGMLLLFISLKITKKIKLHILIFLVLIFTASVYLAYIDGYTHFGISLIFSYPLIIFFFMGPKKGLILNGVILVSLVILLMNVKLPLREEWYPMIFSTSFLAGYVMVIITSYTIVKVYTNVWIKLERSALTDKLTKLPNRAYIYQYLNQLIKITRRLSTQFSVFFLDLDKFKEINDTLGHKIGDDVLITIAERLKNCVRSDDLVGRLGGDEFVIIMADIKDNISPVVLANKLKTVVKEVITIEDVGYYLSMSIGIANYPVDGTKTDDLLKKADVAMYQAKNDGKDCYRFFCQEQDELLNRKLQIEYNLRNGLNNNEFRIVMQPKINTITEEISGVEALLRWNNPKLGIVGPDTFISIAEECGIIHHLGLWAFRESIRIYKEFNLIGSHNIQLAVNLSPIQLQDRKFASKILEIVEEEKINTNNIEFEITEGLLLKNDSYIYDALKRLTSMGFHLAIDDFGTGYSSLSYLKRFKVDTLKIDKSFIQNMLEDNDYLEIVKVIISMAKIFNLTTVAEGVEKIDELIYLKNLGCDQIQGYYYSKPLEYSEIMDYVKKKRIFE